MNRIAWLVGFVVGAAPWLMLIGGGLFAVTAGMSTMSPNGGSLLGLLIALWGAWLIWRREV